MIVYPAKYVDEQGECLTEILNDYVYLKMTVRGVDFVGTDFDGFEPVISLDEDKKKLFTFNSGELCNCKIECEIPILLEINGKCVYAPLNLRIVLGKPCRSGGIDEETYYLSLYFNNKMYDSNGKSGWIIDELLSLQKKLPEKIFIKGCFSCLLSAHHPAGYGSFGCLACFKDVKEEFLKVTNKTDLMWLWEKKSRFVQEVFYCSSYLKPAN